MREYVHCPEAKLPVAGVLRVHFGLAKTPGGAELYSLLVAFTWRSEHLKPASGPAAALAGTVSVPWTFVANARRTPGLIGCAMIGSADASCVCDTTPTKIASAERTSGFCMTGSFCCISE